MMGNLAEIIAWHFDAVPLRDFVVLDGAIVAWNLPVPQPTVAQVMAHEADYLAYVSGDTPLRRAEAALNKPQRLLIALTLRLSASWATMTTAEKNKVQQLLDSNGAALLTALRG